MNNHRKIMTRKLLILLSRSFKKEWLEKQPLKAHSFPYTAERCFLMKQKYDYIKKWPVLAALLLLICLVHYCSFTGKMDWRFAFAIGTLLLIGSAMGIYNILMLHHISKDLGVLGFELADAWSEKRKELLKSELLRFWFRHQEITANASSRQFIESFAETSNKYLRDLAERVKVFEANKMEKARNETRGILGRAEVLCRKLNVPIQSNAELFA